MNNGIYIYIYRIEQVNSTKELPHIPLHVVNDIQEGRRTLQKPIRKFHTRQEHR